ncbi:winged helix-turn-helix transcriptional regulator [Kineosporia rhizophila]|uniref:winged helix-turn-helix transcriptional regulator n=1 Tax=Kineosporia TaxID=49184 RepID=UPI000AECA759|nr:MULTISPECIES: winged helix-turn-helix transcriptional regulator [Kineosporia]MCE0534131.1 winged helix-turn-helix transcriptional regulator [Kineosporia rhizophila]GLY13677.1 hypothetical protein Kisp01_06930 [Kineosporia sp. NBRC 101677]
MHPLGQPISDEECLRASGIVELTTVIGKRWTSGIMLALGRGADRFGQIEAMVQGVSARMLSVRLRELEQHRLVERVVTPTMPVSVTYSLTHRGRVVLAWVQDLALEKQGAPVA